MPSWNSGSGVECGAETTEEATVVHSSNYRISSLL